MSNTRIQYVDAMRGLAMIMVVIWHVYIMCFHDYTLFSYRLNWVLQLPIFVMISGFFASKLLTKPFKPIFKEKLVHLVIPAVIMMSIYCWVRPLNYISTLFNPYKEGYWFTYLLFAYLLIFYLLSKLINRLQKAYVRNCIHLLIALLIAYAAQIANKLTPTYPIMGLLSLELYCYYPYLVIGNLIYQYRSWLLQNVRWGTVIIICFIANIFFYKYDTGFLKYFAVPTTLLVNTLSIMLIWFCFEKLPQLSTSSRAGRFLSFVGQRSIDVYFLHYFFLPLNLGLISELCIELNSTVLSYLIATVLSLIFTVLSLGLGQILRLSPFTAKYLLGTSSAISKAASANESISEAN